MQPRPVRPSCTVCGRSRGLVLAPFRGIAMLCPLHIEVARGIIPAPTSAADLRALFPARVTARVTVRPRRAA
jgi:hypothetical protein